MKKLILLLLILFVSCKVKHNPVAPGDVGAGNDDDMKNIQTIALGDINGHIIFQNNYRNNNENETNYVWLNIVTSITNYSNYIGCFLITNYEYVYNKWLFDTGLRFHLELYKNDNILEYQSNIEYNNGNYNISNYIDENYFTL